MTVTRQISEMNDDQARETYRRIMVEALSGQAEKYDAKARTLREVNQQKGSSFVAGQVEEYRAMATTARRIRDEIKGA